MVRWLSQGDVWVSENHLDRVTINLEKVQRRRAGSGMGWATCLINLALLGLRRWEGMQMEVSIRDLRPHACILGH